MVLLCVHSGIPLTGVVVGGLIKSVMRLTPLSPVRTGGHGMSYQGQGRHLYNADSRKSPVFENILVIFVKRPNL